MSSPRWRGLWGARRLLPGSRAGASALGVLAAAALFVNVNLLVSRFTQRWDVTRERLYSISEPTRATLQGLSQEVELIVLLGRADPLWRSIRQLLSAYTSESPKLQVRYLDPEQNPAEFLALAQRYGIVSGKAEDGRVVTDASIVIAQGERHWFITQEQLLGFDIESGNLRPALEQALTQGIANVRGQERAKVCFSRGHGELSLFDAGPDGMLELRERLTKNNYEVEERDLPGSQKQPGLEGCRLAIVAGPTRPFEPAAADAVTAAMRAGTSALLLLSAVAADDGSIASSGLDPVLRLGELELGRDLV
ncbi:MAG TPA: GldG family protein, partial [Polyangiaceae bacterium]|nr:GldG family protein [Polyangiaceae bacterium]